MNKYRAIADIDKYLDRTLRNIYTNAYDEIANEIRYNIRHGIIPSSRTVSIKKKIEDVFNKLKTQVPITIENEISNQIAKLMSDEKLSIQNSLIARSSAFRFIDIDSPAISEPFIRNILRGGIDGVPISSRIWVYGNQIKRKLMTTVGNYITQGISAEELIPSIKPFLLEPQGYGMMNGLVKRYKTLAKRFKDVDPEKYREFMRRSKMIDASIPRVGTGVYRSAYKNAWRLSVTEFNNAAQLTNLEYYKSLDFVKKAKWNLNPIGHHCETCLSYAAHKPFNLDDYPNKPHPICRCFPTSVIDYDYLYQKYGITQ